MFYRNLGALVNCCSIQDFSIQKGLNQGDSQALFIFFFVTEAFNGLFNKVIESNIFSDFRVDS